MGIEERERERLCEYQQRVNPGVAGISSLPGERILLVLAMRRFHERLKDDLRNWNIFLGDAGVLVLL